MFWAQIIYIWGITTFLRTCTNIFAHKIFFRAHYLYVGNTSSIGQPYRTAIFQSITEPRSFSIRSLDDPSIMFDIELSSAVVCHTFGSEEVFAGHLATSVRNQESCHLKPLSPIFPTFNSFLYQYTMSQSGYHPFMGIQVTDAASHSVSVQGLIGAQKSLKRRIPELNDLRPTTAKKWIILFVVPDSMAASFEKQIIKDADKVGDWDSKIAQYVLGLPEQEVLRS